MSFGQAAFCIYTLALASTEAFNMLLDMNLSTLLCVKSSRYVFLGGLVSMINFELWMSSCTGIPLEPRISVQFVLHVQTYLGRAFFLGGGRHWQMESVKVNGPLGVDFQSRSWQMGMDTRWFIKLPWMNYNELMNWHILLITNYSNKQTGECSKWLSVLDFVKKSRPYHPIYV